MQGRIPKQVSLSRLSIAIWAASVLLAGFGVLFSNLASQKAEAAIPTYINYQSRLRNYPSLTPVTSATSIQFSIYNHVTNGASTDAAADHYTAGDTGLLWKETHTVTPDAQGYFSVKLGSVTPFPSYLTFTTDPLYIGIKVAANAEASPRAQLGGSPFAYSVGTFSTDGSTGLRGERTGIATVGTQGYNSSQVLLQGSGWTGAAAANREIKLQNTVTSSSVYRFSILDNSNAELFSVNQSGLISVVAGQGIDTISAGALTVGNSIATSVSICNSTDCDTISIGTNADGDAINIGDTSSLDVVKIYGASTSLLSFADGGLVDLSAINTSGTGEGLKLPQATSCASGTANGQICWDNDTFHLYVGNGSGTVQIDGGSSITGSDTQVLFFDGANNPVGDAGFTYNKTTDTATLSGALIAVGVNSGSGLLQGTGGLTLSGTVSINDSATTNTTSIGGGTTTGTVSLASGSGASQILNLAGGTTAVKTINLGTGGTGAKSINIGDGASTGATAILSGSGGISLNASTNQPTNINTGTSTGTVTIGGTGALTISIGNGGTGAKSINIGDGASTGATAILSGSGGVLINDANSTVTTGIGGGTTTGTVSLASGSGASQILNLAGGTTAVKTINLGTGGTGAKSINIGDGASTGATAILSGSGGISLNASTNQPTNINTGTSTGTVTIGGTGALTISIGNGGTGAKSINIGDGASTGTTNIKAGSGGVLINDANSTVTTGIGGGTTTGTVSLASGSGASQILNLAGGTTAVKTINLGTGGTGAKSINIGDGASTGATAILSGSGGISLNASTNQPTNINTGTSTGTVTIGGTGALTISIGNGGTGAKSINIGDGASTGTTNIKAGSGGVLINDANSTVTTGIGGGTTTGTVSLASGSGASQILNLAGGTTAVKTINLGTGGTGAKSINIGDGASTGTTTIQSGSGGILLNDGINNATSINTGSSTGTVTVGGTGTQTIAIGSNASGTKTISIGNDQSTGALTLKSGTGGIGLAAAFSGVTISSPGTLANQAGGNGTAAQSVLTVTGGNGGATSFTTGGAIGGIGGGYSLTAGAGGASTGNPGALAILTGGAGGGFIFTAGAGGANTGAPSSASGTVAGGTAGALSFSGGTGGAVANATNGNSQAGAGGAVTVAAGNGGANTSTAKTNSGGSGASTTITSGNGGSSTGAGGAGNGNSGGSAGLLTVAAGNGGNVSETNGSTTTLVGGSGGIMLLHSGDGGGVLSGTATTRLGASAGYVALYGGNGGAGATANGNGGSVYLWGGAKGGSGANDGIVSIGVDNAGTLKGRAAVGQSSASYLFDILSNESTISGGRALNITNSTTGGSSIYGAYITLTGANSNNYGLYSAVSGAGTNNYGAYLASVSGASGSNTGLYVGGASGTGAKGLVVNTGDIFFNGDGNILQLPVKTNTGDPSGAEGDMYYNTFDNKFRCYQNSAWTDCVGSGSTITGSDTQVLFFDGANNPAGDGGLTYNKTSDVLTTNGGFISTSGGVTIGSGQSYTGSGAVNVTSATGTTLYLDSGTTGAVNIGTSSDGKAITIGNTSSNTSLTFNSGGTGSQTYNSGVSTGTTTTSAFVYSDTALTSGTGMYVTSSSVTSGTLLQVSTGSGNTWTGDGFANPDVGLVDIKTTSTGLNGGAVLQNIYSTGAESHTYALYGTYTALLNTGGTNTTHVGAAYVIDGATGSSGMNVGVQVDVGNLGINGTTADTNYGLIAEAQDAALTNNVGGFFYAKNATNNYALIVPVDGGLVGLNTSTPDSGYFVTVGASSIASNTSGSGNGTDAKGSMLITGTAGGSTNSTTIADRGGNGGALTTTGGIGGVATGSLAYTNNSTPATHTSSTGGGLSFTTGAGGAKSTGNLALTENRNTHSSTALTVNSGSGGALTLATGAGAALGANNIVITATAGGSDIANFTGNGGTGGQLNVTTGKGGDFSAPTGSLSFTGAGLFFSTVTGGIGGAIGITAGNGGDNLLATYTGTNPTLNARAGAGGAISITAGTGGAAKSLGAAGTNTTGNGGALNFLSGGAPDITSYNPSTGATTLSGGSSGSIYIGTPAGTTISGVSKTATNYSAGASGSITLNVVAGGSASGPASGTGTLSGGAGGGISLASGGGGNATGGAGSSGTRIGGTGGSIVIYAGNGGTASTGTLIDGSGGSVSLWAGTKGGSNGGATDGSVYLGSNNTSAQSKVFANLVQSTSTTAVCHVDTSGSPNTTGVSELTDCNGGAGDFMELYPTDGTIATGDVVTVGDTDVTTKDGDKIKQLVKTTSAYDNRLIGVASRPDLAGDFNSQGHNLEDTDNPYPIALVGRVKVNIASVSDDILPGDLLTSSPEPGKAMKATQAGQVIGKALESWSSASPTDQIMIFVTTAYADPNNSSERYKMNINGLSYGIDQVMKLRPVSFDWKNTGASDIGFIAEEVNVVDPGLTFKNAKGQIDGVNYKLISVLLTKAIQDQQLQIENLSSIVGINTAQNRADDITQGTVHIIDPNVEGNLTVSGQVTLSGDSVGQVKILAGAIESKVSFQIPYAYQPIVTATPTGEEALTSDIRYSVVGSNNKGFSIKINHSVSTDLIFNWHAFAAKEAKVFVSDGSTQEIHLVVDDTPDPTTITVPPAADGGDGSTSDGSDESVGDGGAGSSDGGTVTVDDGSGDSGDSITEDTTPPVDPGSDDSGAGDTGSDVGQGDGGSTPE